MLFFVGLNSFNSIIIIYYCHICKFPSPPTVNIFELVKLIPIPLTGPSCAFILLPRSPLERLTTPIYPLSYPQYK